MSNEDIYKELYERAKKGENFKKLMPLVLSRENILLAYRNIKFNTGSKTAGTDKLTIEDIQSRTLEEVVESVRKIITGTRGYIPKPNGDKRPLGIPCIWDRLIQQCFFKHQ